FSVKKHFSISSIIGANNTDARLLRRARNVRAILPRWHVSKLFGTTGADHKVRPYECETSEALRRAYEVRRGDDRGMHRVKIRDVPVPYAPGRPPSRLDLPRTWIE